MYQNLVGRQNQHFLDEYFQYIDPFEKQDLVTKIVLPKHVIFRKSDYPEHHENNFHVTQ